MHARVPRVPWAAKVNSPRWIFEKRAVAADLGRIRRSAGDERDARFEKRCSTNDAVAAMFLFFASASAAKRAAGPSGAGVRAPDAPLAV